MKELKTLQESSKIMGGVGAIAIVISFFELADGLSYAKIMLTLVSFLLLCFSVQTYFSYTRNTQGLATMADARIMAIFYLKLCPSLG